MKTILSLLMLLVPAAAFAEEAMSLDFAGETHVARNAPAATAGLAAADRAPAKKKKWTVMVFINGKNDLEMAGLLNMNMMEMVGSTRDLNIVTEIGRMNGQERDTDADGNWTGVRRILVKKDKDMEKITSPVVEQVAQADMGDYRRAIDFVKWSKNKYPAEKYMLILWDHGSGWMDPRVSEEDASKGISFDDETGNYIRTREIGLIAKEAGGVNVMAFDACLMQMAEVLSELKGNAQVMVGSEETIPGVGYPYHLFLGALAREPGMSAEKLGRTLVDAYKGFYETDIQRGAQLSAVRVGKAAELEAKAKAFAEAARAVNDAAALKAARNGVMRYDAVGAGSDPRKQISFYGDLFNYSELVESNLTATGAAADDLKAKGAALREFIARDLVIHNNYYDKDRMGRSFADSHGISVYLPPVIDRIEQGKLEGIFEGKYQDFEFSKKAGWHGFVTYLYGVR